jgi:hypothetical protein
VAVDAAGDVFVADTNHNAVKEVLPNGTIRTIGFGFNRPFGVAVDAAGDVFVADTNHNAVKEVLPNGTIRTIGSGFNRPYGVAVDAASDVFVADTNNHAVKEVLPDGAIRALGSGFNRPSGVAVDAAGDVFVADTYNNRVVELSPPTVAATPSPLTGSQVTAVSASLTGLAPGTTYYFRAVASSPGGTVAAPALSFTTLTVSAAALAVTAIDFVAPAGGPYRGPVAIFTSPDPLTTAASYSATLTWGDRSSSLGLISDDGDGTFRVNGTHTDTDRASYAVGVLLRHNQGFTTTATTGQHGHGRQPGQPVRRGMAAGPAFWAGQGGQALVGNFDGGPSATTVSAWRAETFPNLFGIANHSRLSVWQVLQAIDGRARLATAYPGDNALQHQAEQVLDTRH